MTAPERISAWTWQLDYPSKKNGTREWNAVLHPSDQDVAQYIHADLVQAMVAEAVAKERERCARVAEEEGWEPDKPHIGVTEREEGSRDCAERIAAAIRAGKGE